VLRMGLNFFLLRFFLCGNEFCLFLQEGLFDVLELDGGGLELHGVFLVSSQELLVDGGCERYVPWGVSKSVAHVRVL